LFADTNVFIHCKSLEELDWSTWNDFQTVEIVVTRAVQREIDALKGRGNDRRARRARKTSSRFREILEGKRERELIRKARPSVRLAIRPELAPDPTISPPLCYGETDDQLVGTVYGLIQAEPDSDARVLTNDTGPMGTAKMLNVPFVAVPEEWLLPPESSPAEKRANSLQAKVDRLRAKEPLVVGTWLDQTGKEAEVLECEFRKYDELEDGEIAELMQKIRSGVPLAEDFGLREPATRKPKSVMATLLGTLAEEVYAPAADKEIKEYTDTAYPAWIQSCEDALRRLHQTLQERERPPTFRFMLENRGTRPANDVLIKFQTRGSFKIRAVETEEARTRGNSPGDPLALPRAPDPPHGKWRSKMRPGLGEIASLQKLSRSHDGFASLDRFIAPSLSRRVERDPNAFYWKPEFPKAPTSSFSLECKQWRHGLRGETFEGELHFNRDEDVISGVLECGIHAQNLSEVFENRLPVRVSIRRASSLERANQLVRALVNH